MKKLFDSVDISQYDVLEIVKSVSSFRYNREYLKSKYSSGDGLKKVTSYTEKFESGPESIILDKLLNFHTQLGHKSGNGPYSWIVNQREYKPTSDGVWWHHDGLYEDLSTTDVSHFYTKAQLSTCTGILCLEDLNFTETLLLMNTKTNLLSKFKLKKNRLFLFDNLNFIHAVPKLHDYKSIIGFRIVNPEMCAQFNQTGGTGFTPYSTDSISGYLKLPDGV